MDHLPIIFEQIRIRAVAQTLCAADDLIEYRPWIAWRRRHLLQHVNGSGLMRDPLAVFAVALGQHRGPFLQCAIDLRTADGDHRLFCEGLQEFDLTVGEATSRDGV